MRQVVNVNPFRCRVWKLHDRLEEHIDEQSCKAEIASFMEHGQLVPVLGRRLHNDPNYEVELVYGARRLFVARHINKPLAVELRDVSDRDAIIAMDMENRQRTDISPYERGMGYARWLRSGHFESQDDLARGLKVSSSQVSRLLKISRLPSVVVAAFNSPVDIREVWGLELANVLEDSERRAGLIQTARAIAASSSRMSSRETYQRLIVVPTRGRKQRTPAHDKVVTGSLGQPLFRVQYRRNGVALVLPVNCMSTNVLEAIESALVSIVEDGTRRQSAAKLARPQEHAELEAPASLSSVQKICRGSPAVDRSLSRATSAVPT